MGPRDVVRLNAFVTGREHLKAYMAARDRFVASPPPASTPAPASSCASS